MRAAAPFELAAGRVTGLPIVIGGAVATDAQFYFAGISASAEGTLTVRPPPAVVFPDSNTLNAELRLVERSGTMSRVAAARFFSSFMALSPMSSGPLAAAILDQRAGTQDLSLMDLSKDRTQPLTPTRGFTESPVWSADGKRLAYAYQPPGQTDDVYVKDVGTGVICPSSRHPRLASTPSPGRMTVDRCSSSHTKITTRTCRHGRSSRARSRSLSGPGPAKARRSRRGMTTWPSPHRSRVAPRFTSPRSPTAVGPGPHDRRWTGGELE